MHVVFSGGGTGGHLFPGLAVAQQLRAQRRDVRITFCGNGQPFDRTQVDAAGFAYRGFPCAPWRPSVRGMWKFYRRQRRGARMAGDFLLGEHVSLVVGLGGYASVPAAQEAGRQNIPLVLLEQNVVPGRANRWLARSADLVCVAFDETRRMLPANTNVVLTGNPLRAGFVKPPWPATNPFDRRLVILGGSQGARDLNEEVPRALYKVRALLSGWEVVHVCGANGETTQQLYQNLGMLVEVQDFVRDMSGLLAGANLAISRAGGTTLAELAALGVPAILIPFPRATNNHQQANAEIFLQSGAAAVVDSRQESSRLHLQLVDTISPLLEHAQLLKFMGRAMGSLSRPKATAEVTGYICQLLEGHKAAYAA